jgi:hypothetical protein
LELGLGILVGAEPHCPPFEENLCSGIRVIVDHCNVVTVFDPVAIDHITG